MYMTEKYCQYINKHALVSTSSRSAKTVQLELNLIMAQTETENLGLSVSQIDRMSLELSPKLGWIESDSLQTGAFQMETCTPSEWFYLELIWPTLNVMHISYHGPWCLASLHLSNRFSAHKFPQKYVQWHFIVSQWNEGNDRMKRYYQFFWVS